MSVYNIGTLNIYNCSTPPRKLGSYWGLDDVLASLVKRIALAPEFVLRLLSWI
jgi:hypothetical protein